MQLCILGRFVGIVDPGEAFDLTGTGLLVQALGIAFLSHVKRRIDVDFRKRQAGIVLLRGHELTISSIRTDKAGDGKNARLSKEL